MKILGISGSHRKGNTDWMVKTVLNAVKNAETEFIALRDLNIKFCTGCDVCYGTGKPCILKDDMPYEKLLEADIIILGSPNYFRNVSAVTKNFKK